MSQLQDKQCPQFKSVCLLKECAWYDERLDNCAVRINYFNMFKLKEALEAFAPALNQNPPAPSPFPAQPMPPGMA